VKIHCHLSYPETSSTTSTDEQRGPSSPPQPAEVTVSNYFDTNQDAMHPDLKERPLKTWRS